jgi:hypothetical protein
VVARLRRDLGLRRERNVYIGVGTLLVILIVILLILLL